MPNQFCGVCSQPILMQIFKGTGVCSERCRKRAKEWADKEAKLSDPPETVTP